MEDPIRLKFGGAGLTDLAPARQVTDTQLKALEASHEVVSEGDGTRYVGVQKTGQLTVKGGSDRTQRRDAGLSARQWKKLQRARRRDHRGHHAD